MNVTRWQREKEDEQWVTRSEEKRKKAGKMEGEDICAGDKKEKAD